MQNLSKVLLILSFSILSLNLYAEQRNERIVYGADDRIETYQSSAIHQKLAKSTAGMYMTLQGIDLGSSIMLPPASIKKSMGLCESERFSEQPSAVTCSGFLVGPDLLVTAGHCITNQKMCDNHSWVFDYKVESKNIKSNIIVPKKNVYKCKRVIEATVEGAGDDMRDYSLVQLDRVVEGRQALEIRTEGQISDNQGVVVIGHPSGLPQKVAGGAKVFKNQSKYFFETNLDTFGGNSGSAVFNAQTNKVEGILVRGSTDYLNAECGNVVNKAPEDITGKDQLGEGVSRILDIPSLSRRANLFLAIKKGDLNQVKSLIEQSKQLLLLYDNQKNNALMSAIKNHKSNIAMYLIETSIDLNMANLKGETALHLAAYFNNKLIARKLMEKNVDPTKPDHFGRLPSGRSNYFSIKLRRELRSYERTHQNK